MKRKSETIGDLNVLIAPGTGQNSVVLFHGYGSCPEDLYPIHNINPRLTWIFPKAPLRVPISIFESGNAWFRVDFEALQKATQEGDHKSFTNAFPGDSEEVKMQVKEMLDILAIPPDRCILGGFSQGAVMATETTLEAEEKIAALLILSGTIVNEEGWNHLAKTKAGLEFFQCHGKKDKVLPYSRAQKLEKILKKGGLIGSLYSFKGGHELSNDCLKELYQFLGRF
ncbi:MAG: hypothetical protein S4CHLAM45_07280 [Chlamydiales bacterium]|nr:hypothetical protein [Chlamydiales bacterium]MCH9620255.1 hypothetical protein [Chlamydiales bacterium]MCH9622835.1 hypothetical protein [Chlamydiales bacterium]